MGREEARGAVKEEESRSPCSLRVQRVQGDDPLCGVPIFLLAVTYRENLCVLCLTPRGIELALPTRASVETNNVRCIGIYK